MSHDGLIVWRMIEYEFLIHEDLLSILSDIRVQDDIVEGDGGGSTTTLIGWNNIISHYMKKK